MTVLSERPSPRATRDGDAARDIGRLAVSCVDGPGIVARITTFLHRRGANIVQSDQFSTGSTGGRFFLRTEFHLPGLAEELADLERDFGTEVASVLNARFGLRDASVPT